MFLYHLHVMKAWSEKLFIRIPNEVKDCVWNFFHVLMFYPCEIHFDENLGRFCVEFQHILVFATYINSEWAGMRLGEDCGLDLEGFFIWWHGHGEPCWMTLRVDKVYSPPREGQLVSYRPNYGNYRKYQRWHPFRPTYIVESIQNDSINK